MRIVDATTRAGQEELDALLASRRALPDFATLKQVLPIVERVLRKGEPALREYVKRFDQAGAPSSPSKKIFSSVSLSLSLFLSGRGCCCPR